MTIPLSITFRNIRKSSEISELVAGKAAKLRRLCPNLIGCHVTIKQPHANHQTGNDYSVLVRASLPGANLVGRAEEKGELPEHLFTAIANAFRSVERQIRSRESRRESKRRSENRRALSFYPDLGTAA